MHRLLYTSRAAMPAGVCKDTEVEQIAAGAGARNETLGLTGILVHSQDVFIQVLEGQLHALEGVFEQICCDFRHIDLRLIDLVPIHQRLFANWNMACLSARSLDSEKFRDELDNVRFLVGINAGEAVNEMHRLLDIANQAQGVPDETVSAQPREQALV